MLTLLLSSLIAIACAVFGVHSFNGKYTCSWIKFKQCSLVSTIPSGIIVACILLVLVYRGVLTNPGMGMGM
jgi:hypothetical protein